MFIKIYTNNHVYDLIISHVYIALKYTDLGNTEYSYFPMKIREFD